MKLPYRAISAGLEHLFAYDSEYGPASETVERIFWAVAAALSEDENIEVEHRCGGQTEGEGRIIRLGEGWVIDQGDKALRIVFCPRCGIKLSLPPWVVKTTAREG